MGKIRTPRHIHKYHRVNMYSQKVWACALPDCNHYMPTHMSEMVPGKASICWGCGTDISLDEENMKQDKPQCTDCLPTIESMANLLRKRI